MRASRGVGGPTLARNESSARTRIGGSVVRILLDRFLEILSRALPPPWLRQVGACEKVRFVGVGIDAPPRGQARLLPRRHVDPNPTRHVAGDFSLYCEHVLPIELVALRPE